MSGAPEETARLAGALPPSLRKTLERQARDCLGLTEEVVLAAWSDEPELFNDFEVAPSVRENAARLARRLVADALEMDLAPRPWNSTSPRVARALLSGAFNPGRPGSLLRALAQLGDSWLARLLPKPANSSVPPPVAAAALLVTGGPAAGTSLVPDAAGCLTVSRASKSAGVDGHALRLEDRTIPRAQHVEPLLILWRDGTLTFELRTGSLWVGDAGTDEASLHRLEGPETKTLLWDSSSLDFRFGSTWLRASFPVQSEGQLSLPSLVAALGQEMLELSADQPRVALCLARQTAEAIAIDAFRRKRGSLGRVMLDELIRMLVREGIVDDRVEKHLRAVQRVGNFVAHPTDLGRIDEALIDTTLSACWTLIEWYFGSNVHVEVPSALTRAWHGRTRRASGGDTGAIAPRDFIAQLVDVIVQYRRARPRVAILLARQCAELVARMVLGDATGKPKAAEGLEDELMRKGQVPPGVAISFINVRDFGNVGSHASAAVLSAQDVAPCLISLEAILRWYFDIVDAQPTMLEKARRLLI